MSVVLYMPAVTDFEYTEKICRAPRISCFLVSGYAYSFMVVFGTDTKVAQEQSYRKLEETTGSTKFPPTKNGIERFLRNLNRITGYRLKYGNVRLSQFLD